MTQIGALLAAWATMAGLAAWSAAMPTRALGEPQAPRPRRTWTLVALLLAAQLLCATALLGPVGGPTLVACAWMLGGWAFTMALNGWPAGTLNWSRRSGWLALVAATGIAAWLR